MIIIKIHHQLYRVYNGGECKDVWVKDNTIQQHTIEHNRLTEEERRLVEMEVGN